MRRSLLLPILLTLTGLVLPGPAVAAPTLGNWDGAAQRQVLQAGLMTDVAGRFDGAARVDAGQMRAMLHALASRAVVSGAGQGAPSPVSPVAPLSPAPPLPSLPSPPGVPPVPGSPSTPAPSAPAPAPVIAPPAVAAGLVSVTRFDRLVVDATGLGDVAAHVQVVAEQAGLHPPSYFGSEVVARYLGLRFDHPAATDSLELYPWDPITRAEAAHSLAVMLGFSGWEVSGARQALGAFALPRYDAAQRTVLRIAVAKIGMPYVWGGTTDDTADGLAHGGYDCSGFAWRVYKVSGLPWGAQIGGRTAAQQAGEIPVSRRVAMSQVRGADLLFFGSARFRQRATEANVIHEGIALGNGWVIHSSGQGVYVEPLTSGWLHDSFTWGRRLL